MPLRRLIAWLLAGAAASTIVVAGGAEAAAPRAVTSAGTIEGLRRGVVDAYLGVPSARPPRGPLRWRAPSRSSPERRTRGERPAPSCRRSGRSPVSALHARIQRHAQPDEDCLNLTAT
jgi:carboxylesterase type B